MALFRPPGNDSLTDLVDVAAVLIARNEEQNIARCIESVFNELESARDRGLVGGFEVVLVDSASTDDTVEIARRYPVRILRLRSSWPLSAAAGRYTGFRHTSGSLVLFLDGDEVLRAGWLETALTTIRAEGIAAVAGQEIEASPGYSILAKRYRAAQRPESLPASVNLTDSMCSGIFRRAAVDQVGGIQPFLKGAEDRDLGTRLVAAGWKLLLLPQVMAEHYWSDERSFGYIDYFRSVAVWSMGEGQVFRHRFENKALRAYYALRYVSLRYTMTYALTLALLAVGLANLAALLFYPLIVPVGCVDGVTLTILYIYRKRRRWSWRELSYEFQVVPYTIIRHAGFALGVLRSTPDASRYPMDPEILASDSKSSGVAGRFRVHENHDGLQ